jgi:hypothetical protein
MFHRSAAASAVASEHIVNERLAGLSAKSLNELTSLPGHSDEDVIRDGYKFRVSIWHDMLASCEHRIVVQAAQRGLFGFGWRMHAKGFAVNNLNARRALTEEERSPFS